MGLFIKTSSGAWSPALVARVKTGASTWSTVVRGFVKTAANAWSQFWPATSTTYTFYLGDTVHIGTNGYISFDGGQSVANIANTTGRVLGVLPRDLVLNTVRYAADSSKFYVFWRGYRYSGGTANEIEYEVHFTNGQNYAQIKLVSFPITTYDYTGFYVGGSSNGYSRITATRTVGAEYRIYFGTTAASTTPFTEYGSSSSSLWLIQSTVTAGTSDDGYISIVANQGSYPQPPTSITASSITNTTATVSWDAILNVNAGMSAIQSYEYSTNGGSSWTSTSTTTSANLTGLTQNTSYTVLVRANNEFFTGGVNYGSVTFSTTNLTAPSAVTSLSYSLISGGARISWSAPSSDGGSAITRYEVKRDSFAYFSVGLSTIYDYTLSSGTYTVYVRAVNAIGNGTESSISVTIPTPTPTVDSCTVQTGGRTGTSPSFTWPNPKALFTFTCTNASSADVQIEFSQFGTSWTAANVVQNLSVFSNQVSIQTNQPGTNIGNYYYRATCKPYSGFGGSGTAGTQRITASVQNTATPKNQAIGIS